MNRTADDPGPDRNEKHRPSRPGAYAALVPGPDRSDAFHDHADVHQTIRRATEMLEFLWASCRSMKLAEIARNVGLERSTALRLLQSLADLGYVHRNEEDKSYAIGFMAQRLGSRRELLHVNVMLADRFVAELAGITGEAVGVGALEGTSAIYHCLHVPSPVPDFLLPKLGVAYCAHANAAGLALLGNQSGEELQRLYSATRLERQAARTITSVKGLILRSRQCRAEGHVIEVDEAVDGRTAIAVPVVNSRGLANMAVTIFASTASVTDHRRAWLLSECHRTVERIYRHILC